ncbi:MULTISPECIES: hypothetical protein [unclassified Streptomyces]|uniref:hypothetical protein n=1 Tax=unclassified Streptomyces TaxID=2593676 RepID=UPI000DBA55CC|nr:MULTISPECIES: hypothetical protein [unclassified Streptomyces]MYT70258.1 hypothetical protein [Streptomyces sp. SID8367]RAJ88833.1 hypothetical protein K377_02294 [Streptomyces sp. PsTaAH-137]
MTAPHRRRTHGAADLRLLRAAVFAAVCVVLSAAGHVLGSTATVPLWTLGLGSLLAFCAALPMAGRERSLPGIAATLGVGQIALHSLFGLGQSHASMTMGTDRSSIVERAARLMCGAGASALSPAQARRILDDAGVPAGSGHQDMVMGGGSTMALLPSLPMVIGHLLAAAGAGWLLRHGDLALGRIVALSRHSAQGVAGAARARALRAALALVRALRAGLPGAPEALPRVARPGFAAPLVPRAAALAHSVSRRGPPAADAFLLAA